MVTVSTICGSNLYILNTRKVHFTTAKELGLLGWPSSKNVDYLTTELIGIVNKFNISVLFVLYYAVVNFVSIVQLIFKNFIRTSNESSKQTCPNMTAAASASVRHA